MYDIDRAGEINTADENYFLLYLPPFSYFVEFVFAGRFGVSRPTSISARRCAH